MVPLLGDAGGRDTTSTFYALRGRPIWTASFASTRNGRKPTPSDFRVSPEIGHALETVKATRMTQRAHRPAV